MITSASMATSARPGRSSAITAVISAPIAAPAANLYWDINGPTAGAGNPANGNWDSASTNWSTDAAGSVATGAWLNDGSATAVFSAGTDATSAYTVTLGAAENI